MFWALYIYKVDIKYMYINICMYIIMDVPGIYKEHS